MLDCPRREAKKWHGFGRTLSGQTTCARSRQPPTPKPRSPSAPRRCGRSPAAQNFPQPLPNLGYTPWTRAHRAVWLEVSHWPGELPKLEIWPDWVYGNRYNDLFGRFTYKGQPIYGSGTTNYGAPTDGYGRLVYLDTLGAPLYGSGWRRENSFVSHNPTGVFCHGLYPFDPH